MEFVVDPSPDTENNQPETDPLGFGHAEGNGWVDTPILDHDSPGTIECHVLAKQKRAFMSPRPEQKSDRQEPSDFVKLGRVYAF